MIVAKAKRLARNANYLFNNPKNNSKGRTHYSLRGLEHFTTDKYRKRAIYNGRAAILEEQSLQHLKNNGVIRPLDDIRIAIAYESHTLPYRIEAIARADWDAKEVELKYHRSSSPSSLSSQSVSPILSPVMPSSPRELNVLPSFFSLSPLSIRTTTPSALPPPPTSTSMLEQSPSSSPLLLPLMTAAIPPRKASLTPFCA